MSMDLNKKFHNKYKMCSNHNNHILKFGEYGFRAESSSVFTETKIELLQRLINKLLKQFSKNTKSTKCWNRLTVNSTATRLSSESRMGKGKGAVHHKILYVKPGQVLFEFSSISLPQAFNVLEQFKSKVPFKVRLVKRII